MYGLLVQSRRAKQCKLNTPKLVFAGFPAGFALITTQTVQAGVVGVRLNPERGPFITCALKKKGIEFCWNCEEHETCEKWMKHRESGKKVDSFRCYQKLEDDIEFIQKNGVSEFEKTQKIREHLLNEMLQDFNDGRSKSYYCIAATVLEIEELKDVLTEARKNSYGLEIKSKSKVLHSELDEVARKKDYWLKLKK